jgi:hypothetical protein
LDGGLPPRFLIEYRRPERTIQESRGGSVKRVASALGEGSIAVAFGHQVLRQ